MKCTHHTNKWIFSKQDILQQYEHSNKYPQNSGYYTVQQSTAITNLESKTLVWYSLLRSILKQEILALWEHLTAANILEAGYLINTPVNTLLYMRKGLSLLNLLECEEDLLPLLSVDNRHKAVNIFTSQECIWLHSPQRSDPWRWIFPTATTLSILDDTQVKLEAIYPHRMISTHNAQL